MFTQFKLTGKIYTGLYLIANKYEVKIYFFCEVQTTYRFIFINQKSENIQQFDLLKPFQTYST